MIVSCCQEGGLVIQWLCHVVRKVDWSSNDCVMLSGRWTGHPMIVSCCQEGELVIQWLFHVVRKVDWSSNDCVMLSGRWTGHPMIVSYCQEGGLVLQWLFHVVRKVDWSSNDCVMLSGRWTGPPVSTWRWLPVVTGQKKPWWCSSLLSCSQLLPLSSTSSPTMNYSLAFSNRYCESILIYWHNHFVFNDNKHVHGHLNLWISNYMQYT